MKAMVLVIVLVVCAYLLYGLVKAIQGKQVLPPQEPRRNELVEAGTDRVAAADRPREEAMRDVLATFAKLESEHLGLRQRDFIDGGHARDCYIESTRQIRTLLNRALLGTAVMFDGEVKKPDIEELKRRAESLAREAEIDVKTNGYGTEAIDKYRDAFHSALDRLLKSAHVAFNDFAKIPDRAVSKASSIAALKALPHLIEEAHRATQLAHLVFDVGPYWATEQGKRP